MDLLLKANDIRAEFAARDVLDIDEVELYGYDRIGLIGDNGAGKSTLLHVLAGMLELPGCKVQRFGSITYIAQLDDAVSEEQHDPAMLSRLGVSEINVDTMSGGEETRLKIAAALSGQAHAIFADEPTCHLDRAGIDLLIGQLKTFDGALVVVSHDRFFLDSVVDKIWELKNGKISEYWGGYSAYLQQKEDERAAQAEQYQQAVEERERLERAATDKRKQVRQMEKSSKGKAKTESAGRNKPQKSEGSKEKSLHAAAKNMEHRIEALSDIKAPESVRAVRFRQSPALELHNKFPVTGEDVRLTYGDRVIFDGCNFVIPLGAKVALTGGNGTGKTTLFKMILEGARGITVSPKAVIGYFAQTGYRLQTEQPVMSFMEADCDYSVSEIRSVLASMGFGPRDIMKPLSVLSGGEMIKLTLSKILTGRYNILLMDEPGNYLDLGSMEALENMIKGYAGTIVFISHDRRLIENAADMVYEIKDQKIRKLV